MVSVTNKEIQETVSRPIGSEASVYTTMASNCSNSHPPIHLNKQLHFLWHTSLFFSSFGSSSAPFPRYNRDGNNQFQTLWVLSKHILYCSWTFLAYLFIRSAGISYERFI